MRPDSSRTAADVRPALETAVGGPDSFPLAISHEAWEASGEREKTMYKLFATKDDGFLQLEREGALAAFRAAVRLREMGWLVTVSR